uniref:Uncharacterized protein n=1 Tax=Timema cristinae TaxID=61476 RepID=A0A7R9H3W0_TIMCR|nr:unnamed protein product [Timema cristinae]
MSAFLFFHERSKQGNKKSPQQHISRGNSMAFRNNQRIEISDPLPSNAPNGSDSDHTSLLPKHEGCNGVTPIAVPSSAAGNANPANLQTNLFGHFKGFSITPIHSSPMKLPSPPSRTPSAVSPPTVPPLSAKPTRPLSIPSKPSILNRNASSVGLAVTSANSVATSMAPDLPPANSLSTSRPVISSPVLDTTTCTAKELMTSARPAPTRPAPQVPVSLPSSNKTAPKLPRPLSSPNTLTVNPIVEEKKGKDSPQSYPTLTRLASFMLRQNVSAPSQANEKNQEKGKGKPTTDDKTNSLPRKANKLQIDREALRNLKISNPIPQQDIDVPDSALSVGLEDDAKQVVMRAQSMRDPAPATQRPAIPTFGSMRQPSGNKRPTSIPAGVRPTSPPPPRPPPPPINNKSKNVETGIIGMPGYQNPPSVSTPTDYGYDDCLNLLTAGNAPLANIDEESSPTSGDNIYAVIEESPPERGRKNILKNQLISEYSAPVSSKTTTNSSFNNSTGSKFHYASPSFNDYKSPKPLENSTSAGSIESVGLLSEIVNEIQSRNFESIYSTSTLGKKSKKENEEAESSLTATDSSIAGSSCSARFPDKSSGVASSNSSLGTYMNTPYPSSNLYGGGGSIYSNLSMRNNPASSPPPNINSNHSSSGSSSGYLNPTPLTSSAPLSSSSTPQSMTTMNSKPLSSASMTSKPISSLVSSSSSSISKPSNTAPSNKLFSTFKTPASVSTPAKTSASTTLEPSSSSTSPKENKTSVSVGPENIATYKPYSSSLHRPMGPLAASFKSSSLSSTAAVGTASTAVHNSSITSHSVDPKFIKNNSSAKPTSLKTNAPSVTSPTSSSQDTSNSSDPLPTNLATVQANKSSLHASSANSHPISNVSSFSTAKPASVVTKPAPAVPSSVANLHKGKVSRNESPAANSPDVVSSCSIGNIGNTGKSPDVLGGKGGLKSTSKAPDVVSGGVVKPQSSNTATITRASVVPSIHSVQSSVGSTVSKASNSSASKPTSINSSLRGSVAGKHSQAEVKPSGAKQSSVASGSRVLGDKTRASTPGAASKEMPGKTSSSGRGATAAKSVSDVGANRTMPAGARVAASKLSHVASLQQKFETAASSGDKSGSVGGRTLSNVNNKTKPTPSTVTKSATVKK